jgi:tyrosyl-tRNA synthetase
MHQDFFQKGIKEIITEKSLKNLLRSGKKLRIKFGADPTRPDLHLGHMVALWKLKELQDLGHRVIFIIGDYTAKIGDPSGRNTARPPLSDAEIKQNAKTYFSQVGKILDLKKTEIRYNSEWLAKMTFSEILNLAAKFTVASLLERDDFQRRLQKGREIGLHEVLYPVVQAYDSVVVKADIEIGGSDQKFNILAGRELQKKMGQKPQEIILTKLLVGLDGKNKMSKSADNYIGITEPAKTIFGKVMSLPDELILDYFELCTLLSLKEIQKIKESLKKGANPRDVKIRLAKEIVALYYDTQTAEREAEEFIKVFSQKKIPQRIPSIAVSPKSLTLLDILRKCYDEKEKSNSELRRLINQKAIEINGQTKNEPLEKITLSQEGIILKVGKKDWFRVIPEK